jgi:aminomethyltransferase
MGAEMRDLSEEYSLLAIQGPKAIEAMQSLTNEDLSAIKFYTFKVADFAGVAHVIISATGYTGSGGFEIYCKNSEVEQVWNKVMEAGAAFGIKPIGLAARDTLRLEMGFCLYGNDIDDTTSPIEAGLGWITKLQKGSFNSSDIMTQQKQNGVVRKLVGLEVTDRRVPRHGYPIADAEGNTIGEVTSGTMSPSLERPIGMGYVSAEQAKIGNEIFIQAGSKSLAAKVVKLPFLAK